MDSWSGFYVGAQAGAVWGDADTDYDLDIIWNNDPNNPGNKHKTYESKGLNVDGFIGGIYGGYNWLLSNDILLGVEGEWNYVNADDTKDMIKTSEPNAGRIVGWTKTSQDWDASLRLRAGMVMGDFLPYITGGIAWAGMNMEGHYDHQSDSDDDLDWDKDVTLTGWTLGGGLEMKITENLHARIQYRYTDYGDESEHLTSLQTTGEIQGNEVPKEYILDGKLDYNAHMVTVGLSYRF
jgi:outer membrane immunogenic protein